MALIGATDGFDGYIARRFHATSKLGAILDPAGQGLLLSLKQAGEIFDLGPLLPATTGQAKKDFAGQIVIARIENEVTVKYLDYEKKMVKLVPANTTFEPQLISPDKVVIEGVFVGLIRDSFAT